MNTTDLTTARRVFEHHLTTGEYDKHISSIPMFIKEDACHLHSRGLLFSDGDGWLRISKEIMNEPSYPRRTTQSSIAFPQWNKLPDELKVMVMKECSDITLGDLGKRNPCLNLLIDTDCFQHKLLEKRLAWQRLHSETTLKEDL